MNKLRYCALFLSVALIFSSCLKDTAFLDVSNTQPIVEYSVGTLPTKVSSWGTLADTTVIDTAVAVDIASPQVLNYDVTVTIKFDPTIITNYNTANPTNQLQMLPDSCFSLSKTTVTIPAGYRIGRIPLKLYPKKINPTVSYAMPFAIASTTQSGTAPIISSNASALLYAFIGNPIAGNYSDRWRRWANSTFSGTPSFDLTDPAVFSPNTPTEISMTSPENGLVYIIDFTKVGSVLSNFTVTIDPNSYSAAGLASLNGTPTITVSPDYKVFTISFVYTNTGAAARSIIDIFTKQ